MPRSTRRLAVVIAGLLCVAAPAAALALHRLTPSNVTAPVTPDAVAEDLAGSAAALVAETAPAVVEPEPQ